MLKVEVETLSPIRRRLRVEVPQEQVVAEIERAYAGLSRKARVAGFRPGHAPRHVLERQFGDHVRTEVFGKLIQESLTEAVQNEEIAVVGSPHIETEQAQPGQALRYSATVEVYPQLEVSAYKGLELERPAAVVSDSDVDAYLQALRESLAQIHPVEDRTTVEREDVAFIDYQGTSDGKVVARGENRPCEIGKGNFPPGFEDHLVGATIGTTTDFDLTLPPDANGELAGKTVSFHIHIRSIGKKEVPELDDDFAKDHGECDTLEQLRSRVRSQLEAAAARRAEEQVRSEAVTKAVQAQGELELPAALVDQRLHQLVDEVVEEQRARRIWPRDDRAALEVLHRELTPRAEAQVKTAIVLDGIAGKENIEVTDDELENEIERVANSAGEAADRVRAAYATAEARDNLRTRLRRQRVVELIMQHARVHDAAQTTSPVIAGEGESR